MHRVMMPVFQKNSAMALAQSEYSSFIFFMRFPQEIRNMIWIQASANSKPEVCTHLQTRSPRYGLPGFPRNQPTVDIDLSLMKACRDSREALTSKAGNIRFRYCLVAEINVPCRAFAPSRDTLYLGSYNWAEAIERIGYTACLPSPGSYVKNAVPPPVDENLCETLRQVQNIALEPGLWSNSRNGREAMTRFHNHLSAIFPKAQNLSLVVMPVPLARVGLFEAMAGTPVHRCRLVKATGDPDSVEVQSVEFVRAVDILLDIMQRPSRDLPIQIQNFEVYRQRQGRMRWEKYPPDL